MQTEDPFDQEEYIPSPSEANAELFRTKLSELMGKVNWNTMGTNEKCAAMVRALMDASKLWKDVCCLQVHCLAKSKVYGNRKQGPATENDETCAWI